MRVKKWVIIACFVMFNFMFFCGGNVTAQEQEIDNPKQVILVVVPQLTFSDVDYILQYFPSTRLDEWQMAAMSMRTGKGMDTVHNWFSMVTGYPVTGPPFWHVESWGDADHPHYLSSQGLLSAPTVQVDVDPIRELPVLQGKKTQPGWIGDELENQHIARFVLGNSDREIPQRLGPILTMNSEGETAGWIGTEMLKRDAYFPSGKRTDFYELTRKMEQIRALNVDSLTVVELGDLKRLDLGSEENNAKHGFLKDEWLHEWAVWLESILQLVEADPTRQTTVWVVSPMVSKEAQQKGQLLSPVMLWKPNQSAAYLTSETTKQTGVVANVDFLPQLLHEFNIAQPAELIGKPFTREERAVIPIKKNKSEQITQRQWEAYHGHIDYLFMIYKDRRVVITAYLLTVIFSLIGSTIYWFFKKNRLGVSVIQVLIGMILVSPIFFMWMTPLIQYVHKLSWIMILLGSSFLTSFLLYRFLPHVIFLMVLGFGNAGVILYDIWQGSVWMKRSFLGYDPLVGARFYGLGNEYAGILLGSALLGATALVVWLSKGIHEDKNKKNSLIIFLWLWYGLILYTVSAPHLGTNAGATVAALCAFLGSLYFIFPLRLRLWHFFVGIGGVVLLLLGLAYMHINAEHTHVGSVLHAILRGDFQSVAEIGLRKIQMNLKLIRVSLWGKLFTTSLIVLVIFSFHVKSDKHPRQHSAQWSNGFRAIVLGAMVILLANDSGVVAAASMMMYLTFPFIYLRFVDHSVFSAKVLHSSNS